MRVCRQVTDVIERGFDVIISHPCLEQVPFPIEAPAGLRDLLALDGNAEKTNTAGGGGQMSLSPKKVCL
jgi:hypothetical protein